MAAQELLGAVSDVTLAKPRYRGVDRDDERREARGSGPFDGGGADIAAADQVELIPDGSARRGLDVFQPAPGQGRQHVRRPGGAGGVRGRFFPARIEHATAADRPEQQRKLQAASQDRHAQITPGDRDGVARTKGHVVEDPAVLP